MFKRCHHECTCATKLTFTYTTLVYEVLCLRLPNAGAEKKYLAPSLIILNARVDNDPNYKAIVTWSRR